MSRISALVPVGYLDPRIESLPPAPVIEQDFSGKLDGVIILVSAGDVYLAKACCASVRQAMGNIPITLLVDGLNTDVSELERLPNVNRMVAQEIAGDYAPLCTSFWVKLLVFWKSPYERFLYLDADTLVWGDVRAYADLDKYSFIAGYNFGKHRLLQTWEEIQRYVFDVDYVRKMTLKLNLLGREFANNGVFFARRGVFSEELLTELRQLDCWRNYEQGLTNYLCWRALSEGTPPTSGQPMQIAPVETTYDLTDRFLPRDSKQPAIIHWICKKPKIGRRYRANDDHRKLFLKMTGRTKWLTARLFIEDIVVWFRRQKKSLFQRMK